jgi:hypothetical protein
MARAILCQIFVAKNLKRVHLLDMNAQPSASEGHRFGLPPSCVKVLMMYDDLATGHRVMRVLDSLLRHCGNDVTFHSDMWKFGTLRCASISNLATEDACNADVIIVSAHGLDDLPEELKEWFHQWVAVRSNHPGALVLLEDRAPSYVHLPDPLQGYLEEVARQANMVFIPVVIEGEETDLPIRHAVSEADEAPASLEAFCRATARLSSLFGPAIPEEESDPEPQDPVCPAARASAPMTADPVSAPAL